MAYNIFWNILDKFTKQAQPQVPSFATPQAPRTMIYDPKVNIPTQPVKTQPTTTGWTMWATMWSTPTPSPRAKVAMSFWLNEKDMKLLEFAKSKGIDQKAAMQFVQDKKKEEQATQIQTQEQEKQWPDLWVMWSVWEALYGWLRVWEQIPRYAGNLLNLTQKYVTTPLIAGGAEMLWADEFAQKWRTAGVQFWEGAKALGEDITKAGEWDITEKQRTARRFGASMVATAPIPLGTASKFVQGAGLAKTALRWGIAWFTGTPVYTALEEWRLPTASEQAIGTVWGAVLWTALEKVAIPGIQKWIETVQKKINPYKFTQQIDDETVKLVRQAVRPSISWVDTANKFDVQDAKLLQWVKENKQEK